MSAALIPASPAVPAAPQSIAQLADLAVLSLPSPASRRNYAREVRLFLASGLPLDRTGIQTWLGQRRDAGAQPGTLAVALAAVRLLVKEAWVRGLVSDTEIAAIDRIKGTPQRGERVGNWLDLASVRALIDAAGRGPQGTRNAALVACMVGCGLRRSEAAGLTWAQWQKRMNRYVWADIRGKGGRVRTIPCPRWAADYVEAWKREQEQQQKQKKGEML